LEGWYDGRERDTTDRPLDPAGKNRKTTDLNRRCIVPRLKGRKRAAARRALENRGCKVGRVEHRPARRSKQGRIVAQQPPPETVLPIDAGVDFVIGRAD
jgi:beta-lactam-binding protein with PASTA domain